MRPQAIIFDLDGTLVDTITIYERAVIAALAHVGIAYSSEHFVADYMAGKHLKDILTEYGLTEERAPTVRSIRDELYEDFLQNDVTWFQEAEPLLIELKQTYPLGIVTGSWRSYVDSIQKKLHIDAHVNTIVTADDMGMGKFMKPHPHGLLLAADRMGVDPAECVYVGDQAFDMEAAKRAGMRAILIPTIHTPEEAKGMADQVLPSLQALRVSLRSSD